MHKTKSCHERCGSENKESIFLLKLESRYQNIFYNLSLNVCLMMLSRSSRAFLSSGSLNSISNSNYVIVPCSGIQ